MLAIQAQRYCRQLLKRERKFESKFKRENENKFINSPKLNIEVPPGFIEELQTIKRERMKRETRTKRIIYTCISAVVGFIILGVLYVSGRGWN